ncbi:MAG: M24 family metallopeptidase [Lentisphaeria bacterium]|nr:M24 family metallopeptidase [Lentisphaeria bacterium]
MTPSSSQALPRGRLVYAGEHSADMVYASGFIAPDPFLWYQTEAGAGMVVGVLEWGRARRESRPGTRVRSTDEVCRLWRLPTDRRRPEHLIAGLARETGVRCWEVPGDFPVRLARALGRRGVRLLPLETFCPSRALKTTEEVAKVREGVTLAERGLERAIQILRASIPGGDGLLRFEGSVVTAERLRGEIDAEIARHGGSASRTITAPGLCGADCHDMGSGPIAADTPIVLDIFPRVDRTGYYGDLTRTVVRGRAPNHVRRAFDAVRAAQEAALAAIRAGVSAGDVHRTAADVLEQAGMETDAKATPPRGFYHGLGHGLGLAIHESPRLHGNSRDILEAGHVVTVEPGVYYPEWGGVRLEDVVVVTADGCLNLTTAAKVLEL